MNNNTLKNCKFIKTVLMILVILYHSLMFWDGEWFAYPPKNPSIILKGIAAFLSNLHIYAFVLISGYIFAYKMKENGDNYNKFIPFIKNKVKRLLVPFIFVAIFWSCPIAAYFYKWDKKTIIDKYVLGQGPNQLWFLLILFFIFIFAWCMYKAIKDKYLLGWAFTLFLFVLARIGNRFIMPNYYEIWTACKYFIYFYLGMRIRQKEDDNQKAIVKIVPSYVWLIMYIVVFAVSKIIILDSRIIGKLYDFGISFILTILGAIAAFRCLDDLANHIKWDNRLFKELALCSMPMYLLHEQIVYVGISLFDGINPYAHALIIFIIAFSVSYLISKLLLRFKITRFLIGEK